MNVVQYFDATLVALDADTMHLTLADSELKLPININSFVKLKFLIGLRGAVERDICKERVLYIFVPYRDQSLKRLPKLDDSEDPTCIDASSVFLGWHSAALPAGFIWPAGEIPPVLNVGGDALCAH